MTTTTKSRTSAYQFTFNKGDEVGLNKLKEMRETIKKFNALQLETWGYKSRVIVKYRVCVKARLGRKNPNAEFYKNSTHYNPYQCIKMEHGSYFDVYIQAR